VKEGVPWIYGAAVGSYGVTLSIRPGESACLTCVFESAPPAGSAPTCDTVGVLASTTAVIGALEAAEALKFLAGRASRMSGHLTIVDVWEGRFDRIAARRRTDPPCTTCVTRRFPNLAGAGESRTATLCGRNSVQVSAPPGTAVDLEALASRLAGASAVERTPFLVRTQVEGFGLTVFGDGRAIIEGTRETERARAVYARYVGS